ncbi:DNA helicase UvrD [bacterium]|nr:DNA helicase UvrD [bacterium]
MAAVNRLLNIIIALDQLAFALLTLGSSAPDETMSSAAYRLERAGKWQGKLFRPVIDFLFSMFEHEHCKKAYLAELNRNQLPPTLQKG